MLFKVVFAERFEKIAKSRVGILIVLEVIFDAKGLDL